MTTPEFCREIPVSAIEAAPSVHPVEADAKERTALARRLGIVELQALSGEVTLRRRADQRTFEAAGTLQAKVVQECVVTLDPFESTVEDRFDLRFAPEAASRKALDLDPDEDAPEPLEGDSIDIGELVAQQLSLALNPHPRKPGAKITEDVAGAEDIGNGDERPGPFARLAELKKSP